MKVTSFQFITLIVDAKKVETELYNKKMLFLKIDLAKKQVKCYNTQYFCVHFLLLKRSMLFETTFYIYKQVVKLICFTQQLIIIGANLYRIDSTSVVLYLKI